MGCYRKQLTSSDDNWYEKRTISCPKTNFSYLTHCVSLLQQFDPDVHNAFTYAREWVLGVDVVCMEKSGGLSKFTASAGSMYYHVSPLSWALPYQYSEVAACRMT